MINPILKIPEEFINRHFNDDTDLPDYRTIFMRDRDRVMYCTAFKRLAGKTQIYTIGSDDHKKNRLTHSMEVAQIARTIALALDLDEALTEAIALGHDFGHTPFGHAGEQMLHKTKQRAVIPAEQRIITPNAHEAIITPEQFETAKLARQHHHCPASYHRENIFRGLLFCDCCGHPLSIAHRKLKHHEEDLYRCMHHFHHPAACPKTHAIYHSMLYPYVLSQVRNFAKSMRRRKVQSPLAEYGDISELTPEILNRVIERIEVGHVTRKSVAAKVVRIYWKLA